MTVSPHRRFALPRNQLRDLRTGGGITRGGETMPRPDASEYALVVRPRGDGVDSELAGWLTGLHGASAAGGQGAVGSFHRMCDAQHSVLSCVVLRRA